VLAAEVAGEDEGEPELRNKSRWYFDRGVAVVWIVLPESRDVLVMTQRSESRHARGDRLPTHGSLPGLAPRVDALFAQLDLSSR
jgi:hypothetical protein